MKLQILFHQIGADSCGGYDQPADYSEIIGDRPFESMKDLITILRASGFAESPYTILYGGHPVDDLKYDGSPHIRQRTILAVPKDPVVKILLQDSTWTSSVGNYEVSIKELKRALQERFESLAGEIVFIDTMGNVLEDKSNLLSVKCFADMKPLICKKQVKEYMQTSSKSDRMNSVLSQALSLQQEWCALGDIRNEIEQVRRNLANKLKVAHSESLSMTGSDVPLKAFAYDRFEQDFPPQDALPLADSSELHNLKAVVSRSVGKNSAGPALARKIIDSITSNLQKTSLEFANQSAQFLGSLVEPLAALANKNPKEHDHDSYHEKLERVKRSLHNYKDIMAGKMFGSPEEMQQRTDSLQSLHEVSHFISCDAILENSHFSTLLKAHSFTSVVSVLSQS